MRAKQARKGDSQIGPKGNKSNIPRYCYFVGDYLKQYWEKRTCRRKKVKDQNGHI